MLWRNLTQVVGDILESLGLDPQGSRRSRCWNAKRINVPTSG